METAKGKTREETINRLADRIDSFEKYTQPHSRLIAALAARLARRFGLATPDIEAITEAALLHDIGLYAMSPSYHALTRPLSFEARLDLWRHSIIGEQQMAKRDSLRHAQLLVRWHHEWWNGSGYPDMLAFEDIPIGARIIRAVELCAALLSDRPYRAALDEQQAVETLISSAGIECDPYVVKTLVSLLEELRSDIRQAEAANDTNTDSSLVEPRQVALVEQASALQSVPFSSVSDAQTSLAEPNSSGERIDGVTEPAARPWGEDLRAFVATSQEPRVPQSEEEVSLETQAQSIPGAQSFEIATNPEVLVSTEGPTFVERPVVPLTESILSRLRKDEPLPNDSAEWRGWIGSRYNKKLLLGFQASVLRQLDFRSIAIPFWSEARLDWYLKAWGRIIFANDPRQWAGIVALANIEATQPLDEDTITRILEEVYVPRGRLSNPGLRRWFGETDAWWMDNLRRNIDMLEDTVNRAQALTLGLQTGDYALSFDEETLDLRRPLTTVFWRLAGRAFVGATGQPHRCFNEPAEDFIRHARADLLYLRAPSSHSSSSGSDARSEWREAWVSGGANSQSREFTKPAAAPQSKQSYLAALDRLLTPASSFKVWAIEYQEPGLASAHDIIDLIKEHRPVKATYSKDVTEVTGGLKSSIIVADKSSSR